MNENRTLEHEIRAALDDSAPFAPPNHLLQSFEYNARRKRRDPRWLALIKEPTMRTNSHLAVGSPTARVAAIMVATLLAAVMLVSAGIAGSQLLAADGRIVVDQSGGGDFTTIAAAVAEAEDGDEIVVKPGTYTESVVIDKDITVRGDGPIEDVVVMAPEGAPEVLISPTWGSYTEPYAVQLLECDATLADLTFTGEPSTVIATGGSPTISGLVLQGVGTPYKGGGLPGGNGILVNGSSTATVSGNVMNGGGPVGIFDLSEPLVEGNTLADGPHIWGGFGDGTVIRGNTISGPFIRGIFMSDEVSPLIDGNTITDPGQDGIDLKGGGAPTVNGNTISGGTGSGIRASSGAPTISGNTVSDTGTGISASGGAPTISDNMLTDNGAGVVAAGDSSLVERNTVAGGRSGIVVTSGSGKLDGNTVTGASGRGLAIGGDASPTLTGNTVCENGENLWVNDGAEPVIDESNEICEDAPAE